MSRRSSSVSVGGGGGSGTATPLTSAISAYARSLFHGGGGATPSGGSGSSTPGSGVAAAASESRLPTSPPTLSAGTSSLAKMECEQLRKGDILIVRGSNPVSMSQSITQLFSSSVAKAGDPSSVHCMLVVHATRTLVQVAHVPQCGAVTSHISSVTDKEESDGVVDVHRAVVFRLSDESDALRHLRRIVCRIALRLTDDAPITIPYNTAGGLSCAFRSPQAFQFLMTSPHSMLCGSSAMRRLFDERLQGVFSDDSRNRRSRPAWSFSVATVADPPRPPSPSTSSSGRIGRPRSRKSSVEAARRLKSPARPGSGGPAGSGVRQHRRTTSAFSSLAYDALSASKSKSRSPPPPSRNSVNANFSPSIAPDYSTVMGHFPSRGRSSSSSTHHTRQYLSTEFASTSLAGTRAEVDFNVVETFSKSGYEPTSTSTSRGSAPTPFGVSAPPSESVSRDANANALRRKAAESLLASNRSPAFIEDASRNRVRVHAHLNLNAVVDDEGVSSDHSPVPPQSRKLISLDQRLQDTERRYSRRRADSASSSYNDSDSCSRASRASDSAADHEMRRRRRAGRSYSDSGSACSFSASRSRCSATDCSACECSASSEGSADDEGGSKAARCSQKAHSSSRDPTDEEPGTSTTHAHKNKASPSSSSSKKLEALLGLPSGSVTVEQGQRTAVATVAPPSSSRKLEAVLGLPSGSVTVEKGQRTAVAAVAPPSSSRGSDAAAIVPPSSSRKLEALLGLPSGSVTVEKGQRTAVAAVAPPSSESETAELDQRTSTVVPPSSSKKLEALLGLPSGSVTVEQGQRTAVATVAPPSLSKKHEARLGLPSGSDSAAVLPPTSARKLEALLGLPAGSDTTELGQRSAAAGAPPPVPGSARASDGTRLPPLQLFCSEFVVACFQRALAECAPEEITEFSRVMDLDGSASTPMCLEGYLMHNMAEFGDWERLGMVRYYIM